MHCKNCKKLQNCTKKISGDSNYSEGTLQLIKRLTNKQRQGTTNTSLFSEELKKLNEYTVVPH